MRYFNLCFLLLFLIETLPLRGQNVKVSNLVNRIYEKYSLEYVQPKQKNISVNGFSVGNFKSLELKKTSQWVFKSKKAISKNNWRYFNITTHLYSSPTGASQVFNNAKKIKSTGDDGTFGKGWSFAIIQGNIITILKADCSFPKDQWDSLKSILLKELKHESKVEVEVITCECGGLCS